MLVTNTTKFSSLPLRSSTSCSHERKIQFPLPCWKILANYGNLFVWFLSLFLRCMGFFPQCSVISGTPVTGFVKPWRYDKWCFVGSAQCVIGMTSGELDIRGFNSGKEENFTFTASR